MTIIFQSNTNVIEIKLPSSNSSIKSEGNKELPRIQLIRLNPQALLLEVNIVSNRHRLLMLHIGRRLRRWGPTRVRAPPSTPIWVVGPRPGPGVSMVVIKRCRQRRRRRRWRRVISGELIIRGHVRVRGRVWELGRVRGCGGENVAVAGDLGRLRGLRVLLNWGRDLRRGLNLMIRVRMPSPALSSTAPSVPHFAKGNVEIDSKGFVGSTRRA